MTEHPILFSTEMVKAILEGPKTMTRRVINFPLNMKHRGRLLGDWPLSELISVEKGVLDYRAQSAVDDTQRGSVKCPYGQPGHTLWVKETFYYDVCPWANGGSLKTKPPNFSQDDFYYRADGDEFHQIPECEGKARWRPARFMPRWASRITLEVLNVRVERVQEITEEDCVKEGISKNLLGDKWGDWTTLRGPFQVLWNGINGKRAGCSWNDNPWVWMIEFRQAM